MLALAASFSLKVSWWSGPGLTGMRIAAAVKWRLLCQKLGLAAVLLYSCLLRWACASSVAPYLSGSEVETALLLTPFLPGVLVWGFSSLKLAFEHVSLIRPMFLHCCCPRHLFSWFVFSLGRWWCTNLVDPASSHMLVSKIKPCMSQYKLLYSETANGSLKQL